MRDDDEKRPLPQLGSTPSAPPEKPDLKRRILESKQRILSGMGGKYTGEETSRWLTHLEQNPTSAEETISTGGLVDESQLSMPALLDMLFDHLQRYSFELNKVSNEPDMKINVERPVGWHEKVEYLTKTRYMRGHLSSRYWSFVVWAEELHASGYFIPTETLIGFDPAAGEDYPPYIRIDRHPTRSDDIVWAIEGQILPTAEIPRLARRLITQMVKLAAGEASPEERFTRQTSDHVVQPEVQLDRSFESFSENSDFASQVGGPETRSQKLKRLMSAAAQQDEEDRARASSAARAAIGIAERPGRAFRSGGAGGAGAAGGNGPADGLNLPGNAAGQALAFAGFTAPGASALPASPGALATPPAGAPQPPGGGMPTPPGALGASPGSMGTPPGAMGTPPGAMGTPPGAMGTPPGAMGTPPGAMGTPPGAMGTPPGAMGTPPGAMGTPPGAMGTPPGAMGTPPGAMGTPPGATGMPPGMSGPPPGFGAPGAPTGLSPTPPGGFQPPPSMPNFPTQSGAMPNQSQSLPPGVLQPPPGFMNSPGFGADAPPGGLGSAQPPGALMGSPTPFGPPPGSLSSDRNQAVSSSDAPAYGQSGEAESSGVMRGPGALFGSAPAERERINSALLPEESGMYPSMGEMPEAKDEKEPPSPWSSLSLPKTKPEVTNPEDIKPAISAVTRKSHVNLPRIPAPPEEPPAPPEPSYPAAEAQPTANAQYQEETYQQSGEYQQAPEPPYPPADYQSGAYQQYEEPQYQQAEEYPPAEEPQPAPPPEPEAPPPPQPEPPPPPPAPEQPAPSPFARPETVAQEAPAIETAPEPPPVPEPPPPPPPPQAPAPRGLAGLVRKSILQESAPPSPREELSTPAVQVDFGMESDPEPPAAPTTLPDSQGRRPTLQSLLKPAHVEHPHVSSDPGDIARLVDDAQKHALGNLSGIINELDRAMKTLQEAGVEAMQSGNFESVQLVMENTKRLKATKDRLAALLDEISTV